MDEQKIPSFNLWTEPWITLEKREGGVARLSIEQTLKHAQDYRAIYEQSPLVVVGIHRLLVAILQFAINPQENEDLRQLWRAGQFSPEMIDSFGSKYAHRFDLFSTDAPFMQSSDLPLEPDKKDKVSYVSRLAFDIPSGTYVSHYRHGDEKTSIFCPVCIADHLVMVPAFATSGGAGIKPSINGVPPVYIIPGGDNLYQSLIASLVTPAYQPEVRSRNSDSPWWEHNTKISSSHEVNEVGYCYSLTFPARRIRVYPSLRRTRCTRCGEQTGMPVNTIIYEMGETRSESAEVWFDPFVAYLEPAGKRIRATPIRPNYRRRGWATWREFAGLFLLDMKPKDTKQDKTIRPKVLDQLMELELENRDFLSFHCVSVMTDSKGKNFQWMDAGFNIPPLVLRDENAGYSIRKAVGFATECNNEAARIFVKYFRRAKSKQYDVLKQRMEETFWVQLANPFRQYVLKMDKENNYDQASEYWAEIVIKQIQGLFKDAGESAGQDAERLGQYARAEKELNIQLGTKRKEFLNE